MSQDNKVHPWVQELAEEARQGRIDRRDFLRWAGLLGVSLTAAAALAGLPHPPEAAALSKEQERLLDQESPFELKNRLIQKAEESCGRARAQGRSCRMINTGRGNPNFLNTTARQALAVLTLFAAQEAGRGVSQPHLGFRVDKKGLAARLREYLADQAALPGADFLAQAVDYAEKRLGLDADEVAFELVDGVQGDFYPSPPRIFPVTEAVVNRYLERVLYGGKPPAGKFHLFATEGATAAMVYVFNSLKQNQVLRAGDHIAIFTPIFSPYLEIPALKEYNLRSLYLQGDEDHGWLLPDAEIAKLADRRIKALYLVNPTNPTSVALSRDTVRKVAQVVKAKNPDLIVINDTVYASFVDEFHTLAEEIPQNTIGVYSYSKYFGVTGWRLGVVAVHDHCVVDRIIARLPAKDQALLDLRYRLTSTTPRKIKFYQRLEIDSRDVALAHTGGLSGPQQVAMCLFSLFELMDQKYAYKKTIMSLLQKRWAALYQGLELPPRTGDNLTRYYALIDLERMARARHGRDFARWLAGRWPLGFLLRLAEEHQTVCLPGEGFAGPKWSLRVSLANVSAEECLAVGRNIVATMDRYHQKWKAGAKA